MKRFTRDIIRFTDGYRARRTVFEENGRFFAKRFGGLVEIDKDVFGVWREKKQSWRS